MAENVLRQIDWLLGCHVLRVGILHPSGILRGLIN